MAEVVLEEACSHSPFPGPRTGAVEQSAQCASAHASQSHYVRGRERCAARTLPSGFRDAPPEDGGGQAGRYPHLWGRSAGALRPRQLPGVQRVRRGGVRGVPHAVPAGNRSGGGARLAGTHERDVGHGEESSATGTGAGSWPDAQGLRHLVQFRRAKQGARHGPRVHASDAPDRS